MGKTVSWGAGGWTPGTQVLQRIEAFELRMLRKICQVPRGPEEDFVSYSIRSAGEIRDTLARLGQHSLAYSCVSLHHSWAGHSGRLPPNHPVARILRYRDLSWWHSILAESRLKDPKNLTAWRRPRPGRPIRWEEHLVGFYQCDEWYEVAQDRNSWKSSQHAFVVHTLEK